MRVTHELESVVPELGQRIRQAREISRKSITELASLAQMSRGNWYKIEEGYHKSIPLGTLKRLENALNTDFGSEKLFG
jgi:transcriptional regulator with XRE-family HTH domain